jgi:hypothetical protein
MEPTQESNENGYRIDKGWWVKLIILIVLGGFYLYFGIRLLLASYQLNNPFYFLMTFFASNFIILISAALLIGFACRLIVAYRYLKNLNSN